MRRAVITTTVNVPENLRVWRAAGLADDDVVIVAGDRKTPHGEVRKLLADLPGENVYLAPEDQTRWRSSAVLGWNTIRRRNIALLEAMSRHPDYITTIDDDNFPETSDYFTHVDRVFSEMTWGPETHVRGVASPTGWYNAGHLLDPAVTARGYPLGHRHDVRSGGFTDVPPDTRVGVVASLWLGDPDIDAVERIVNAPETRHMVGPSVVLDPGTWCPFNTQSTSFLTELAPLMMVWPAVGRYDDIWASYLAQRVMRRTGHRVYFGRPLVRQERNEHDLVADLRAELLGMEHTGTVTDALRSVDLDDLLQITKPGIRECLRYCYRALGELSCVPDRTVDAFDAWLADVDKVLA